MKKIEAPTSCPSCDSKLTWKNELLYCVNSSCKAKSSKAIEHWAKTLKIKGLGPKSIETLDITAVEDLYSLSKEIIVERLGSEKLGEKLYIELEKSKKADLSQVLPAFGISLIGKSATGKLASTISNLSDLTKEKATQAGLGPKATENLLNWFNEDFIPKYSKILPMSFKFEEVIPSSKPKQYVCISGKLKTFKTKSEAANALEEYGYKVKDNVTKEVSILINESGVESSKTRKARESGVTIITDINELMG